MKNSNYLTFSNNLFGDVRVINDNNEPLFCLSDICKVLEIQNSSSLAEAIKIEFEIPILNIYSLESARGIREMNFITEPQLYFILMRSDKPNARAFRQWIVNVVLPNIRKNGYYKEDSIVLEDSYNEYIQDKISNLNKTRKEMQKAMKLFKEIEKLEKNTQNKYLALQTSIANISSYSARASKAKAKKITYEENTQDTHLISEDKGNKTIIQNLLDKCKTK